MADVQKLDGVFWEEVLEELFEQYEFIAIRMKEESGKRMGCQRMMLPVISKQDTDMYVASGRMIVESWWLKEDEEAMEALGYFGWVLCFHGGRCTGVRADVRRSFRFSPVLEEFGGISYRKWHLKDQFKLVQLQAQVKPGSLHG